MQLTFYIQQSTNCSAWVYMSFQGPQKCIPWKIYEFTVYTYLIFLHLTQVTDPCMFSQSGMYGTHKDI